MPGNTVPSLARIPVGSQRTRSLLCLPFSFTQPIGYRKGGRKQGREERERRGRGMGNRFQSVHSSFSLDFSTCHVPGTAIVQQGITLRSGLVSCRVDEQCNQTKTGGTGKCVWDQLSRLGAQR